MEFNWGDSIWGLMLVERPPDTHLSESRGTPGGKSPLVRDDEGNTLDTHAVLWDGKRTALVVLCTGMVLGAAVVKAAPYIKGRLISFKSKLSRRTEETTEAETPVSLTVVAEVEPEQLGTAQLRAV